MYETINISKSHLSFLNYNSRGNAHPSSLKLSEDGFLALVYLDSVVIGTVSFQLINEDTKYLLTEVLVEIDFKINPIIKVSYCTIPENEDEDYKSLQVSINEIFNTQGVEKEIQSISRVEWSPFYSASTKCYLGVMTYGGKMVILGQNKRTSNWEKEIDLTTIYHQYYKERLLNLVCDTEGHVRCNNVEEYIKLKQDMKLTGFSWSSIVRQSKSLNSSYLMLSAVSESGIVTIWRLIGDQIRTRLDLILHFQLDCPGPKIIQFCDLSRHKFFLSVCLSGGRILGKQFQISETTNDFGVVLAEEHHSPSSSLIIIRNQFNFNHVKKCVWSVVHKLLVVGYDSQILFICFDNLGDMGTTGTGHGYSSNWVDLPSTEEISGIVVKDNAVFVSSRDGYLFGIKLESSLNMESLELNDIFLETATDLSSTDREFLDLFMSPNGVHLGLLRRNFLGTGVTTTIGRHDRIKSHDILLIQMMPEKEILTILMDENRPFSRKQDAVEEMRHLYFCYRHALNCALQKLSKSAECQWETAPMHNLQLSRYLLIFVGYQMNISEVGDGCGNWSGIAPTTVDGTMKAALDYSQVQRIESIILLKNLKQLLVDFTELTSINEIVNQEDCAFVLSLCTKLTMVVPAIDFGETVDKARQKARLTLINLFSVTELDIDRFVSSNCSGQFLSCPVCGESCDEFNLFISRCSKNSHHVVQRCCKSLELCSDRWYKKCTVCGAIEKAVDTSTLSIWRLGIFNSNCPLCDGKFVEIVKT